MRTLLGADRSLADTCLGISVSCCSGWGGGGMWAAAPVRHDHPEKVALTIFVGNSIYDDEEELRCSFTPYGVINRVRIVQNRATGRREALALSNARRERSAGRHHWTAGGDARGTGLDVTQAHPRQTGRVHGA